MVGTKGTGVSDGRRQSEMNGRGSMCDPKPGLARWARVYGAKTKIAPQIEIDRDRACPCTKRKKVKAFCWWCVSHASQCRAVGMRATIQIR